MKTPSTCLALLGALLASSYVSAAEVTLFAEKDNTIYEPGNLSNGVGKFMFAGRSVQQPGFSKKRALLAFDLDVIPAGSTINSVSLQLYNSTPSATSFSNVSLHRVVTEWGEGGSDSATTKVQEGIGAAPVGVDATWTLAQTPATAWTTPGGDFVSTPSATTFITSSSAFYTWSSPGMVDDAQYWLDSGLNFGWLLMGNESTPYTAKRFNTRENLDPATRPMLTVDFTTDPSGGPIPEPSAFVLLGCIACATCSVRGLLSLRRGSSLPSRR